MRRDTPREPVQKVPGATSAPQERRSLESIMPPGQSVARLFGRQPPRVGLEKSPEKEPSWTRESRKKSTRSEEKRQTVPQDGHHPEVMPNGGFQLETHGLETGREF